MRARHLLPLIASALLLAACANTSTPEPALAPNANLLTQNIPPIPLRLVQQVQHYTEFAGHGFVAWHPTRREMLISHRPEGGNTTQLYLLKHPMARPERLTDFADPVSNAQFEPRQGQYLVFARGSGGDEAFRLYRMALDTLAVTELTGAGERAHLDTWLHRQSVALVSTLPLDRTAGKRAAVTTSLWWMDPLAPAQRRLLAELPGGGWEATAVAPDDRQVVLERYLSAEQSEVWLMDLASGARRRLLPAPDDNTTKARHVPLRFTPDGSGLLLTSDRTGEFRELMRLDIASGALTRATGHIPWNVSGATSSADGRWLALQANVDGRDELRLFDAKTLQELPAPAAPRGNIGVTRFHKQRPELALSVASAQAPSQIYTLDPASGQVEQWTRATVPAVPGGELTEQQVVRWPSFDGRTISGLLNLPPARFNGPRPVLIAIHGGPESQAQAGFAGRNNYLLQEMGIAILQPNVRGSSGYGKRFLELDNGRLREDSVKDIGALLDWIATQPGLDAKRVVVSGGSYGGYMALAVATHYDQRIAGTVDVVGISHFVTFLQNTESYRRDLRRVEYGDERDPAMREFLHRISPLTNAAKITKPLFVVQGRNDPRVPFTEAEQIVERVRANGSPVWYLRGENEGHGFARKENADFQFYATVQFLKLAMRLP